LQVPSPAARRRALRMFCVATGALVRQEPRLDAERRPARLIQVKAPVPGPPKILLNDYSWSDL